MRIIALVPTLALLAACANLNTYVPPTADEEPADTAQDAVEDTADTALEPEPCTDSDGDEVCNEDDPCPFDAFQSTDADQDGVCDELDDDCPTDPGGYVDSNGDGACDGSDDSDGDGIIDAEESAYGSDCMMSNPNLADTDGDGVADPADPFPRDPWPEYILYRNDLGTIDVMLSQRNGVFDAAVEIGDPYGGTGSSAYRYRSFVISDFDNDGKTDFLAVGDAEPSNPNNLLDIWWFYRHGHETGFQQRLLGQHDRNPLRIVGDMDNDWVVDLVALELDRPNYIAGGKLTTYTNASTIKTATCFATVDPANPNGCAFVEKTAVDVTNWVSGQWTSTLGRDAVDVDGDGNRDIAMLKISSGGNSSVPVAVLSGNGDGTLQAPTDLFQHNSGSCGNSPANSMLFGDFDNDAVGDIIVGLDDDGDPGSAWFYPGTVLGGVLDFDTNACIEAFDLNPANESGSDDPGQTGSARSFDFDFDGHLDVMVGFNYSQAWAAPSRTELWLGNGNGTFQSPIIVRDFPTSTTGAAFATPQPLCPRFPR